ncbi:SusC/RagA family TonB-linked outer membrane protein [Chryseolinea lacunae]|uniref:SusC/RagA family TonB-linked outer membrane protein n=1 Tax=Chryseolinea lacunae TaxID=2801331 RepID=A0ABS1KYA1_9BACT|nr:SusC/RagA family TonB-linked outer membrane protein [Chryseolinea lacunae]MBL0744431.1 SusC/RagA family TonB-linked outer membrane protein [Chryseolinea lacunae]
MKNNFTKIGMTALLLLFVLCWSRQVHAQSVVLSGVVTSAEDKTPLPGVSIVIKGTSSGTVTNSAGNYTLEVRRGSTLVFSFLGTKTQEVTVDTQTQIDIALITDITNLDEVVVTALGIKREKKAIGYSVSELSGSQLSTAVEVNAVNSLSGKVAGVDISTNTAGPTGSTRVVIRGATRLDTKNQPLYVIDGVPMDNSDMGSDATNWGGYDLGNGISNLNPKDIETISVLKGASASALYGSRASNGVILITTKSGKAQKGLGVEFTSNFTVEKVLSKFDDYQTEYGMGRNGELPLENNAQSTQVAWGAKLDPTQNVSIYNGQQKPYGVVDNNILSFFRTGTTATNTVSVSGGTDKAKILVSASDMRNRDIVPSTGLNRNTFLVNTSVTLGEKLTLSGKANYVVEKVKNRPALSDNPNNVGLALLGIAPNFDQHWLGENYKDDQGRYEDWNGGNIYRINPYWTINELQNESSKNRLMGYLQLNYKFTDWLSLQARAGTDNTRFRYTNYSPKGTPTVELGQIEEQSTDVTENNYEAMLRFDKKFSEDITLGAFVGGNIMSYKRENFGLLGQDIILEDIHPINNFKTIRPSYAYFQKQVNSVFGSAQIGYKETYFLDATFRNDWASTLPDANRSYFYPAVSGSFVFSNVLPDSKALSFGKVRASVAQVGGDTDPYRLTMTYGLQDFTHLGKPLGQISNTQIPNAKLKPTETLSWEVGTDLQFYEGRIRLDLAYYSAKTVNQILGLKIPRTGGYEAAVINAGEITNKGFEIALSGTPVSTASGFKWDVGVNFTRNVNKVVSLHEQIKSVELSAARWAGAVIQAREGAAYGVIVGKKLKRDPNGNIIHTAAGLPVATDESDQTILGNGVYKWMSGISNTFTYKNMTLSALVDVKVGADIYSMSNALAYQNGTATETLEGRAAWYASEEARQAAGVAEGAWTPTGGYIGKGVVNTGTSDNPVYTPNTTPVNPQDYWQNFLQNSPETFIYDATYAKLREVVFSYNFPSRILGKSPFQNISLSFVARNLFILYSNIPNIDPESGYNNGNGQGFEYGSLPSRRSYGLSLNAKF